MANTRTITSVNAKLLIAVAGLYDVPQQIQGFSADDITDMDAVEPVETSMGLDGRLSAGFVPVPVRQNITLQADSLSNDFFENWLEAEKAARDKYVAQGLLAIIATQRKYTMTRGFLRSLTPIPALRRSAQPRRFVIEWERVSASPN